MKGRQRRHSLCASVTVSEFSMDTVFLLDTCWFAQEAGGRGEFDLPRCASHLSYLRAKGGPTRLPYGSTATTQWTRCPPRLLKGMTFASMSRLARAALITALRSSGW